MLKIAQKMGIPKDLMDKLTILQSKTQYYVLYRGTVILISESKMVCPLHQDYIDSIYKNIKQLDFEHKLRMTFYYIKHPIRTIKRVRRGYKLYS